MADQPSSSTENGNGNETAPVASVGFRKLKKRPQTRRAPSQEKDNEDKNKNGEENDEEDP